MVLTILLLICAAITTIGTLGYVAIVDNGDTGKTVWVLASNTFTVVVEVLAAIALMG
jgi:hypothetical protein